MANVLRRTVILLAAVCTVVSSIQLFAPATVYAEPGLGTISPHPGNTDPWDMVDHRVRFNKWGTHNNVVLDVYLPTGVTTATVDILPGRNIFHPCSKNVIGNNLSAEIVEVTMGSSSPVRIKARDLCDSSSTGLYRSYTLRGAVLDTSTGYNKAQISIAYINVGLLDKAVNGADRNAFGFRVQAKGAVYVSPKGAEGSENYSILANTHDFNAPDGRGTSKITIPFAMPCSQRDYPRSSVIVYDADADNPDFKRPLVKIKDLTTNQYVQLSGTGSDQNIDPITVRLSSENKKSSTVIFDLLGSHRYLLEVSDVTNGNALDFGIPQGSTSVYGVLPCWSLKPTSEVKPVAAAGEVVSFRHKVEHEFGNDAAKTRITVSGSAAPSGINYGAQTIQPGQTFSRFPSFRIPKNAAAGTKYCQSITADHGWSPGGQARPSSQACVTVGSGGGEPRNREFSVTPVMRSNGEQAEPNDQMSFTGQFQVDGFPEGQELGYAEVAVRRAVNVGGTDGAAWAQPQLQYYGPDKKVDSGVNGTPKVRCANGEFRKVDNTNDCPAKADGSGKGNADCWAWDAVKKVHVNVPNAKSCSHYFWRCSADNGAGLKVTDGGDEKGVSAKGNPPGCPIYTYSCINGDQWHSLEWATAYSTRCTKFVCNSPSTKVKYKPANDPPGNYFCAIWRCANTQDKGGAAFFNDDLSYENMYEFRGRKILQDEQCMPRCSTGYGPRARYDDAAHGYDTKCYQDAAYLITCNWYVTVNDGSNIYQKTTYDTITKDGTYGCPNDTVSATSETIGTKICAILTPIDSPGWQENGHSLLRPGGLVTNPDFNWTAKILAQESIPCNYIIAKPYFQARGGDVSAGRGMAPSCSNSRTSDIAAWPGRADSGSLYKAGGGNRGAFANGAIRGFATAQPGSPAGMPSGLAFATQGPLPGDIFGGSYPMSSNCMMNYVSNKPEDTPKADSVAAAISGEKKAYLVPTGGTLGATTILKNVHKAVYVDGDLVINGNVDYDRSKNDWDSVGAIPALRIMVKGNIYIQGNVERLNGVYFATGTIHTCAVGTQSLMDRLAPNYENCKKQLVINGSLVANKVQLMRTKGTAKYNDWGSAEQFNYLPEVWQAAWPPDNPSRTKNYDAIMNLPPVL